MNNKNIITSFFSVFLTQSPRLSVYTSDVPDAMMETTPDDNGWFKWRPLEGNIKLSTYQQFMQMYDVVLPKSFLEWHQAYYFLDGDCSIVRLPFSNPEKPLQELKDLVDNNVSKHLIAEKIYPFATEGNDGGYLVFDGRMYVEEDEYPIRFQSYEAEFNGSGPIIFSSFSKMLECLTYFLSRNDIEQVFDLIPHFFTTDPSGAGKEGVDYWIGWINMSKENYEY
ncbi:hypothetical protein [Mucilaginibacter terrae]|uniref:SMI1/KNR4 family protein n=1 Tax=Mucilaginibacter terrae TaxID=1955052 RepID=A0ABU3H133_9SPHI|nr:hypothetical protein [Mucilaginibacter terrae]MDT3405426.1 hypothetical protein [Mucilaginibacter terrae]